MKTKICTKCKKRKSTTLEYFPPEKGHKDGLSSWCRICIRKKVQKYKRTSNGKAARIKYRQSKKGKIIKHGEHLKSRYGITLKDYNKLFQRQNGCCAICGIHQSELNRRIDIDHDHRTKKVRGLLCTRCNGKLSVVEDKEFIKKAKKYLNNAVGEKS